MINLLRLRRVSREKRIDPDFQVEFKQLWVETATVGLIGHGTGESLNVFDGVDFVRYFDLSREGYDECVAMCIEAVVRSWVCCDQLVV